MKFTEDLDQLVFEDKHEVVFERVKLGENVDKMDILVENINGSINHVFRIEESEFPGIVLIQFSNFSYQILCNVQGQYQEFQSMHYIPVVFN